MRFEEIVSQYQIGSIVELKVQKKLDGPKLIIFDIEGVSFRLHISNISNSDILSEKLFNIIRLDEMMTLVIIGFNIEKEYVELSLKPFRNQLEGSLSFTKCRKIIEERKKMRLQLPKDILEENRNQLDRIQGDLAKVDLTFLYELIQNAIDHPNPNFNNELSIKFEVYNEFLLLTHNGSIFTENNFRSLTGILLGEEDTGEKRIGYKGIGFKSIFRYTQEVYIRSGNFSFSFSKSRSGAKLPWEVVPIFENEIDKVEEIQNFEFFNSPVAFAFKFTNPTLRERAIKYLKQLVSLPETLLFLDSLSRLEVVVGNDVTTITRHEKSKSLYKVILLQLDDHKPERWFVCKENNAITDATILEELKDENNPSIPLKFRNFNSPEIQVAFPAVPKENLINLYAYLPLSETKLNLPFIINGDFIPNLDRTDVIRSLNYNNFLANDASEALVQLFNVVSHEIGIDTALSILTAVDSSNHVFLQNLSQSLFLKKEKFQIKDSVEGDRPLKNYVIDKSGLFKVLDSHLIRLHEEFKEQYIFEDLDEDTAEQLEKYLQLKTFDIRQGIELISTTVFINDYCGNFKDIILLIYNLSRLPNSNIWKQNFKTIKIIRIADEYYSLNELHKNIPEKFCKILETVLSLRGVSKEQNLLLNNYPRIAELLESFGLKEFDLSAVLRDLVARKHQFGSLEFEQLHMVWYFLYDHKDVKNSDGSKLVNERFKDFPIVSIDNGVCILEDCYAGNLENENNNFSFLYKNYGKDDLSKVDVSTLSKITGNETRNIISFLANIHSKVRISDNLLFKRAFKQLLKTPHEELEKEPEKLINALLSVFNFSLAFPNEMLIEYGIMDFPVITEDDEITILSYTYFSNDFADFIDAEYLYAERLFENIKGIPFLKSDYVKKCPENEQIKFIEFLRKHFVSPGLKFFNSNDIKINDRANVAKVDSCYNSYNNGFVNFKTQDNFYVFKDLVKLAGSYKNLVVFWEQLTKLDFLNTLTSEISCNGYTRDNPLLWLLKRDFKMFPMVGCSVKQRADLYDQSISKYLFHDDDILHSRFGGELDFLLKALKLKLTLSSSDIVTCLRNLEKFSFEEKQVLMLSHFSNQTFSEEEVQEIFSSCSFIALDKTIQPINKLFYMEESLEESSVFSEIMSEHKEMFIYNFGFDKKFKKAISGLKLPIKTVEDIELVEFQEELDLDTSHVNISVLEIAKKVLESSGDNDSLSKSDFVKCSNITLGIRGISNLQSQTDSFYDKVNNKYYFIEFRDLAELIGEKFSLSYEKVRKLRKLLESQFSSDLTLKSQTDSKANDKFLNEVEEFIKELEGTEWSHHIIELKELLQLDISPSEQKKKVYNLLAKLKLAKLRNIQFEYIEESDRQFNYLLGNGEKYIVHSARGSFAYIAPYELLKMRDEDFMMALDFGNGEPIKIYQKAEDLLSLNTNHLLLYQHDKTMNELFAFCENNQSANKRLLIIDRHHASNKSQELLKLMIPDEEY